MGATTMTPEAVVLQGYGSKTAFLCHCRNIVDGHRTFIDSYPMMLHTMVFIGSSALSHLYYHTAFEAWRWGVSGST